MKTNLRFNLLILAAICGLQGFSQTIIDTIYYDTHGIDSYTNSGATTTNYGTDTVCKAYYDYGSPTKNYYMFLQLDLSTIPTNAIVSRAELNLYAQTVHSSAAVDLAISRVITSWTETGVTYATMPSVTGTGQVNIAHTDVSAVGWHDFNITNQVQYQVENPASNYGSRIILTTRSGSVDKGMYYTSRENANTAHRPYMIVEYHIPVTDTIYLDTDGYDAHVYSGSSGTNFGTDTAGLVSWDYGTTSYANRLFLYGDLSDIPRDKVVSKAELHLYAEGVDNSANHPYYIQEVTAPWTEGAITWTNQPAVTTTNRTTVTHASTSSTGWHVANVKLLAQAAVYLPEKNYGWRLSLTAESGTVDNGITYATSEDPNTNHRPYILVEYQDPIQISGYVTHCTNGNNDGSIEVSSIAGGCDLYTSYYWRKLSAGALSAIETGTDMSLVDVSGLSDGLYLLEITDYRGITGYKYFFVGEEGTTTNVEFGYSGSVDRAKYGEDSWVTWTKSNGDSSLVGGTATTVGCYTNSTYDGRTLIDYKVEWDPSLEFTNAKQCVNNKGGSTQWTNSDNDAWISRVTEPWGEFYVTWATRPSVSTENRYYIPTTTYNGNQARNDTFDILAIVPYWQEHPDENYGFELALNSYSQPAAASRDYASSDYTGHNLMVSFTVKPTIETEFFDSLGLGNILVNAPAGELPYTYLIAYDSLPVFDSIWYAVRDSVEVDSADFYHGRSNTRNYTFTDLPNDHYYIGVYDNNGELLLNREVYLTPEFEVFDSTHLDPEGDTLKVRLGQTSAEATMFGCLPEEESGGFELEVISLADDVLVGFVDVDDYFPRTTAGYRYSLDIQNTGKVYAMRNDSILDSTTVAVGEKLKLFKDENDLMLFYKGSTEFARDTILDTLTADLKLAVNLLGDDAEVLFKGFIKGFKKPKLKYFVQHTDCNDSEGSITIALPGGSFFSPTITGYTIFNNDGMTVASGSSTAIIPLTPGLYTVYYTYTVGGTSFSWYENFVIGYWIDWTDYVNLAEGVIPYHYLRSSPVASTGNGKSQNKVASAQDKWIRFGTKGLGTGGSRYEAVRLQNGSGVFLFTLLIFEPTTTLVSKFVYVYDESGALVDNFIATTNPIHVNAASDGTVTVYNYNTLETTLGSSVGGNLGVKAIIKKGELVNAIASFCYPVNAYVAKTKPTTDGSYFITSDNELNFQYTGEYNTSDLVYELTDETGAVISAANYNIHVTGGSGDIQKNADNRFTLDMQSLAAGFYLLTIVNEKGEKHYLRIKN